jgi:pyruvate formate lyase activating enzyme
VEQLFYEIIKDRIFYEESGGGVTFSGGEPLSQIEFLTEILNRCQNSGIHTAIDTCGYGELQLIKTVSDKTNLFLYDLKIMDPELHIKYTDVTNNTILSNLDYLLTNNLDVILRIPIIPEITVKNENLSAITEFLNHYPKKPILHLLPYHKIATGKYKKYGLDNKMDGIKELTKMEIDSVKNLFVTAGFETRIGG